MLMKMFMYLVTLAVAFLVIALSELVLSRLAGGKKSDQQKRLRSKSRKMSPEEKGLIGERRLRQMLLEQLDPIQYRVLYDIMLPAEDDTTTQVDFIVVSQWGVFVIEAKNFDGWIFGNPFHKKWTTVRFKKKASFQNPLRQNYKHIATLAECLGIPQHYFKTIVAFSAESEFKTDFPATVMHFGDVPAYIREQSTDSLIHPGQLSEFVEVIMEWHNSLSDERKAAHVANLKQRLASKQPQPLPAPPPPSCPNCGAPMVQRTRKSDKGLFWGCPNFPACRGIRQL